MISRLLHRLVHWLGLARGHVEHVRRGPHLFIAHVCATCGFASHEEHSMACECFELAAFGIALPSEDET